MQIFKAIAGFIVLITTVFYYIYRTRSKQQQIKFDISRSRLAKLQEVWEKKTPSIKDSEFKENEVSINQDNLNTTLSKLHLCSELLVIFGAILGLMEVFSLFDF
jgi:hypothetical protein